MKRIAVFASGRGSNFRAILDHARLGVLENVDVNLLVTNDASAPVAKIARENFVPFVFVEGVYGRKFADKLEKEKARGKFDDNTIRLLTEREIDLVVLAGFMQVLGPKIVQAYSDAIMNIHPALDLVRFGGRGMFGERVHAAVLNSGEKQSGCTVHYVDASVDGGPVILQAALPIESRDTPESLADRVLNLEHRTYSKAIQLHVDGRTKVRNGRVVLDWGADWELQWDERQKAFVDCEAEQVRKLRFLESSV